MVKPKLPYETVHKTITIRKNQNDFLKENHISLSNLVKACIDAEIKKWKNAE